MIEEICIARLTFTQPNHRLFGLTIAKSRGPRPGVRQIEANTREAFFSLIAPQAIRSVLDG
jgi:hypothetical protein